MNTQKIIVILVCFAVCFVSLSAFSAEKVNVENLVVSSGKPYEVGESLEPGVVYYIDRDYTVIDMPEELTGLQWIMTGNDDKGSAGEDFITFDVDSAVRVWVARDSRGDEIKGGTPPAWLSDEFTNQTAEDEDFIMNVTDGNMGYFAFWYKDFESGTIQLGGNADAPAAGQGSSYVVLLEPINLSVEPQGKLATIWGKLK